MSSKIKPIEKYSALRALEFARQHIEALEVQASCGDCKFNSMGYCNKWKERPPKEVFENGCEAFEWDESIPF